MTDRLITEMLERCVAQETVGELRLTEILTAGRKARRRQARTRAGGIAVAALALVGAVFAGFGQVVDDEPAAPSNQAAASVDMSGVWTLGDMTYANGDRVLQFSGDDRYKLTFTDGKVLGDLGCSQVTGLYKQSDGNDLVFSATETKDDPGTFCPAVALEVLLLEVRHVGEPSAQRRILYRENWQVVAELERATTE